MHVILFPFPFVTIWFDNIQFSKRDRKSLRKAENRDKKGHRRREDN